MSEFMPKIHIIYIIFERIDFNNLQSISSAKRNNEMPMNKSLCDTNEIVLRGDNIILNIRWKYQFYLECVSPWVINRQSFY